MAFIPVRVAPKHMDYFPFLKISVNFKPGMTILKAYPMIKGFPFLKNSINFEPSTEI